MHLTQLKYFVECATSYSFAQASSKLYISQQALSRSISALESELNTTLFNKSNQGISLTAEGKIFLEFATDVLAKHEATLLKMKYQQSFKKYPGKLHIFAVPSFFYTSFPKVLSTFKELFPSLHLTCNEASTKNICDYIENYTPAPNNYVIGLIHSSPTQNVNESEFKNIEYTKVKKSTYCAYARDESTYVQNSAVPIKSLLSIPTAVTKGYENLSFYNVLIQYGDINISFVGHNLDVIFQYISQNDCIAYLPKLSSVQLLEFQNRHPNLQPIIINEDLSQDLVCCRKTILKITRFYKN